MKTEPIHPQAPSLGKDGGDTIRIGATRVTLDSVVAAFRQGATPEEIMLRFDVLPLAQVYEAISYYLNHREETDAYLEKQREKGEAMRQEAERRGMTPGKELLARLRRRKENAARDAENPRRVE
jgi:uncharacterized protein (DUF433 family)